MWVATDGDKVVGLRAFMRWEFVRGGEILQAVRAVDTATHPDYQGRGLFTAMTMHGLDVVKDDGIDFVFNTPNTKSRPGYLKMGWQEVGRLPVAIKLAGPGAALQVARSRGAASHWPLPLEIGEPIEAVLDRMAVGRRSTNDPRSLETNRSAGFLAWRYGGALLGYRVVSPTGIGAGQLVVRIRNRDAATELVVLDDLGEGRTEPTIDLLAAVSPTHTLRLGRARLSSGLLPAPQKWPRADIPCRRPPCDTTAGELAAHDGRRRIALTGHEPAPRLGAPVAFAPCHVEPAIARSGGGNGSTFEQSCGRIAVAWPSWPPRRSSPGSPRLRCSS